MKNIAILVVFVAVWALAICGTITPPDCDTGGGSALNVKVSVTNLTGNEPYNLQPAGTVYNLTYSFVPITNVLGAWFNVSAEFSLDGVNQIVPAGSFFGGTFFPSNPLFGLLPVLQQLLAPLLPQSSITLVFTVPNLANATVIFRGSVTDITTQTLLVCKQSLVNIAGLLP